MKELRYCGKKYTVKFSNYAYDNRLAAALYDEDGIYGVFTVNIPEESLTDEYCAYIDTNNWDNSILDTIEPLGEYTARYGESGFCCYPEFKFNKQIVEENRL